MAESAFAAVRTGADASAWAAAETARGMAGATARGCAGAAVSGQKTISIAKPLASRGGSSGRMP